MCQYTDTGNLSYKNSQECFSIVFNLFSAKKPDYSLAVLAFPIVLDIPISQVYALFRNSFYVIYRIKPILSTDAIHRWCMKYPGLQA